MRVELTLVAAAIATAACAAGLNRGEPIADPGAIASEAAASTGASAPARVVFEWEYADERGNLRGDGASRVNPPDRFRLDLFSTAEGSMQAVLVDDELTVLGEIEDVQFPPPAFLYAMTGVFRPGSSSPVEGFRSEGYEVVGYPAEGDAVRYFYLMDGRLQRVEERRAGRIQRRIVLEWGEDPTWPREARYRDDLVPNVVRWELVRVIPQTERWPESIYDIDPIY